MEEDKDLGNFQSYKNTKGQLHRLTGPAVIYPAGSQAWYIHNKAHRENGPAVVRLGISNIFKIHNKR